MPQARQVTESLCKKQINAFAQICNEYIGGKETEMTFEQALGYFEQNCVGISKSVAQQFKESQASLADRIAQVEPKIAQVFSEGNHETDAAYLILNRLAGISDET